MSRFFCSVSLLLTCCISKCLGAIWTSMGGWLCWSFHTDADSIRGSRQSTSVSPTRSDRRSAAFRSEYLIKMIVWICRVGGLDDGMRLTISSIWYKLIEYLMVVGTEWSTTGRTRKSYLNKKRSRSRRERGERMQGESLHFYSFLTFSCPSSL